jgi:hypothetical protein
MSEGFKQTGSMNEAINKKRIENYLIEIFPEDSPESPLEWDNLGTMICFHKSYSLGDKHNYIHNDYSGWEEMKKAIIKNENVGVILPLYLYDHSGITISTSPFSCPWDSGQIGFIFISKKKMLGEYGGKIVTKKLKERVTEYLKGEVETYDQYLRGDVYGYRISKVTTCEQGHEHKEELDSCWGYFGEDTCMKEGESILNFYINKEKQTV